jgi:hypothetical protein
MRSNGKRNHKIHLNAESVAMAEYPIPEKLRTAFLDAVRKYDDWWGEPEPEVLLAGDLQGTSISAVCALVELFDDEMPDNLYSEFAHLAASDPPERNSYACGARCLKVLIAGKDAKYRATRERERDGY